MTSHQALMPAVLGSHLEIARALLEHGASASVDAPLVLTGTLSGYLERDSASLPGVGALRVRQGFLSNKAHLGKYALKPTAPAWATRVQGVQTLSVSVGLGGTGLLASFRHTYFSRVLPAGRMSLDRW